MPKIAKPKPLFDTMENIHENTTPKWSDLPSFAKHDYQHGLSFLCSYSNNQATFNAYRREIERLFHWSWLVQKQGITKLRRADIEAYLAFCQAPPQAWVGTKKVHRFVIDKGERIANPLWHPFVATIPKQQNKKGESPSVADYQMSDTAIKEVFAILSSFYNFLVQEEATHVNPVAHIRQKSQFLRKRQGKPKIRRLSELQWSYVIETAQHLADKDPDKHERTLFIMSALFLMYLRISELADSERWSPQMSDFHCDHDGNWWFTVIGKGNKERDIAVSDAMIAVLKRWRKHLALSPLPTAADNSPILPKIRGRGGIRNTSFIRKIVQFCFDETADRLKKDGFTDDAAIMSEATVHWLRHTGISEDVKVRPREHVRDDAGHGSGAITDKYIDIERRERHASAKNKPLTND